MVGADGGHRPRLVHQNIGDLPLLDPQVFLPLQRLFHDLLIAAAVGLGPKGPDGGAFALVQRPVLDAGFIGGLGHLTAQGVDLPDQMALAGAADGGVAGHIAHCVQVDGEAEGAKAQAGGGQSGLNAGMACAYHGHIKYTSVIVHISSLLWFGKSLRGKGRAYPSP